MSIEIRNYGRVDEIVPIPNLMELQLKSYERFLQMDRSPEEREPMGLEGILREIFAEEEDEEEKRGIKSYDGKLALRYLGFRLGWPRHSPDECRQLRLTYGMPFWIKVRLIKEDGHAVEDEVYLGEIPKVIGGGEFIVNGAERVIVSQLHRSPGVDFDVDIHATEKKLHRCRIIPERGSWIEMNVTSKDVLVVRIDQSAKIPATTLLRALFGDAKLRNPHMTDTQASKQPTFATTEDIIRTFYPCEKVDLAKRGAVDKIRDKCAVSDVVDPNTGEILVEAGEVISEKRAGEIVELGFGEIEVITQIEDFLILNTLKEDPARSHEDALRLIYLKLRPGNPPHPDRERELFREKFFNHNKYRLGRVGRFRINRKFELEVDEGEQTLTPNDFVESIKYLVSLRLNRGEIDDIDHLANRRVRTIDELAGDEFRKGFLKLKKTVQERMSVQQEGANVTPHAMINSKTISSAIEYFFGRGELSQVVDQTNPLSQLTHERRLSALGPGGLNRKRASFEVRDVHISHYGRICPIETPEGTNIGLIASLSIFATLDEYGFLITPYRVIKNGRVTDEVKYLRADEEENRVLAPADTDVDANGKMVGDTVMARKDGEFLMVKAKEIEYMDVSPKQLVGVSASLIPYLEHDDANRALMGSNMQRQAVPLLVAEPPVVGTGMEVPVASNSGMVVRSKNEGVVTRVTADAIRVGDEEYRLRKFVGLNERTCQNQKPIVKLGDKVRKHQVIADGAATQQGELALGKNVLVAFMPWDGYNFEDAILVSESLLHHEKFTSIHIECFETEIRETKLGREEFTRDIPNVSEKALRNLQEDGVVRVGTRVAPGDILVGKVVPKSKSELSPEEKLLHAIFGRMGEDVKKDCLEVPSGIEGIVIDAQKFSRTAQPTDEEKARVKVEKKRIEEEYKEAIEAQITYLCSAIERETVGSKRPTVHKLLGGSVTPDPLIEQVEPKKLRKFLSRENFEFPSKAVAERVRDVVNRFVDRIEELDSERDQKIRRMEHGDDLPTGVLELVKVYVATKRTLSVGDKMAGRHGNKGVIAKILPKEDMPFLEDGTPIEIILNPLGVPSRMNVGQILETHLGWAATLLGFKATTPVFDGGGEDPIREALVAAGLPHSGKTILYDGRTGEPFDQSVTVGYIYMLKLHHLVDDKVHARATGPYSLITQQPLGGKARFGGQRFGEMEVWALEAYGAANILQELLTVKSDDVDGRTKIYEAMVKGENVLEPGTPVSFDVLCNEIKGLGLNIELQKKRGGALPSGPPSGS